MVNLWRKTAGLLVCIAVLINIAAWLPPAEAGIFTMSTKSEIELGRSTARQIEKQVGLVQDSALQERVARIGYRMAALSDRPDMPYTFKVLDSKEINAFALPGGFIYVYKGLIDYLSSDEELAGVIGHELGHVVRRHTVKQIEKSQELGIAALLLGGGRDGGFLEEIAMNAIMAGYSRGDEREADQLGFVHTMRAGYNPYGMLVGLQRLGDMSPDSNFDLFADHPEPDVRVKLMKGYMADAKIHPQVVLSGTAAQIIDSGLSLPPLYATYKGYKPIYRAELAAGALYLLTKMPDFSGDHFIVEGNGTFVTIFYDDRPIIMLTPQDAGANKTTLDDLATQYVNALKDWANTIPKS
ncbi:MAG: M48 family metallopeptidase [Negativicutes bacterium]|nr:M48 family metallopeptidase [Negativicutes bacterium]